MALERREERERKVDGKGEEGGRERERYGEEEGGGREERKEREIILNYTLN